MARVLLVGTNLRGTRKLREDRGRDWGDAASAGMGRKGSSHGGAWHCPSSDSGLVIPRTVRIRMRSLIVKHEQMQNAFL